MSATITLSDAIKRLADRRAADGGYADLNKYVESLIVADAGGPISEQTEEHLLHSLQTRPIDVDAAHWESKRRALEGLAAKDRS